MNNKSQIASGIGQIRSRAAQPLRGELAVQLPLRGFHLQKILFSKICTTSDLKKSTISYVLICTLSEARFKRMRSKICYGHQTNIALTILPFHHSHNHGNIFMLFILTVIKVLTGPVIYHHSSYEHINNVNFLYISISPGLWSTKTRPQFLSFPTQSYQGDISYVISVSSHPKSLVHSTLMKDASFAPRRNLKHGVLLIGRLLNIF